LTASNRVSKLEKSSNTLSRYSISNVNTCSDVPNVIGAFVDVVVGFDVLPDKVTVVGW
jgi:hypothetical protein